MNFRLNSKFPKSPKPFFKQLIGHNRAYRLFLLLALGSWLDLGSIASQEELIIILFLLIPGYFALLFLLDGKFRRYYFTVRDRKLAQDRKTDAIFYQNLKFGLKQIPSFLLNLTLPYLTRLPVFEDYFQSNLNHYANRYLLKFIKAIEARTKKIKVYYVDVDSYHNTFYIRLFKPLTPAKATVKLNLAIKKYFGGTPAGVIIKLKRTTGQVLIPVAYLQG